MSSKWNPFNAVVPGSHMVNEVLKEKQKINMPVLSEDQKNEIQEKILSSFNNEDVIQIKYFRGGKIYIIEGKILKIDVNNQKIILNKDFSLFFSQIIEIS